MSKVRGVLQLGTAEAEQILCRFTTGGPKHPTFATIDELDCAVHRPYRRLPSNY
ncbi:hypothetical protein ACWDV4_09810 [Micromonospora sp. NPDC003197]